MKRLLVGVTCAMLGTGVLWAEDGYIASATDGQVYSIDTGYKIKPTTGIYADFAFLARTADVFPGNTYQQFVFEGTGGGTARIYLNGSAGTGAIAWNFTKETVWTSTGVTMVPGTRYQMNIDASARTAWLESGGARLKDMTFAASSTVPAYTGTVKLFSSANGNNNAAMMKLYRFTITEAGETVHDYVPATKGGIAGMYDRTTGEFLYDVRNSPKAFTAGGDVLELEDDPYIEGDGTSWMNSRFFMNPGAKVELDYALTDTLPLQARLLGADGGGATFYSAYYINGSGNMSFGVGDVFKAWSCSIATNLFRHKAVLDVKNIRAHYITRAYTNWTGGASVANGICDTNISRTAAHPMGIFGDVTAATGLSAYNCVKAKIYRVRIWQDDELAHDYVPHVKGGVPGFRDAVDGAFITGENTAAFTAGGNVTEEADDGYVSSSGNDNADGFRYIDTGYTVTPHTRVELDYALADNYPSGTFSDNHDWYLFAAYGGDTNTKRFSAYYNKSLAGWCGCGVRWQALAGVPAGNTGKDVRRTMTVDNHTGWAGLVTAGFTNSAATVDAAAESLDYGTYTLKLAANDAGSTGFAALKIYGCRIYERGELVHDYVPYVQDGAAGLRDAVTGAFVFSAVRRPAFVAGGAIASEGKDDAYIESDGTQGVNIGYLMRGAESRVEADFAFTDTYKVGDNYQQRVFGQDSGGGMLTAFYITGSGVFNFGFGNTFINSHGPQTAADARRHTAVIDGYRDRLHYITGSVTNNTYDISGDAHSNNSTWPMGIFATPNNQAATAWRNPSKIRLYSFRIYEKDELKHEYLPYKKGDAVGLYDTVGKAVFLDARNGNAFKISGKGVDGAERWIVAPQDVRLSKGRGTVMLSANASGAVAYRWTRDGEPVSGGEDGDLTVEWEKAKSGVTETYGVVAVYGVYGNTVEGEPVTVAVEHIADGTVLFVR